ncbi:hypothetical protein [Vibrio methylphosphonaticus]|nr:hypothetical protein [Vibrio methylphosphonaticus]
MNNSTKHNDNGHRPMAKYYLSQFTADKSKLHRFALTLLIGLCQL